MIKFRILTLALGCTLPSFAFATMCIEKTPTEIAKTAKVAFTGIAKMVLSSAFKPAEFCWDASWRNPECGGKLVTLEVAESLRGDASGAISVIAEDACYCTGIYWTVNEKYLVVATENTTGLPGTYIALDGCGGTGRLVEQSAVFDALKSSKE